MLLCIDIGNSSISMGLFEPTTSTARPELLWSAKVSSSVGRTADEYAVILRGLLGEWLSAVTAAVIGSVVPQLTHTLEAAVRRLCSGAGGGLPVLHIGGGVRTGISLRVDDPAALGADIVSNAAAAVQLYGAPVIFFDYGTATVCGAVNASRELIGVSIAPGLYTSLEGLRASAARIPYLELSAPKGPIGKNTPDAIRAGLIVGTACMTDGVIQRLHAEMHIPRDVTVPVVATGGLADLVLPACHHGLLHEPELTLLGLCFIYRATEEREQKFKR